MKRWFVLLLLVGQGLAAQTAIPQLEGNWLGILDDGQARFRLALSIARSDNGYSGTVTSVDAGASVPFNILEMKGDAVRLEVTSARVKFEGSMSADGTQINGRWTLPRGSFPIVFMRAAASPPVSRAPNSFGIPVEMTVSAPPMPFTGRNQVHLVYEMHITNFSASGLFIERLDVLNGKETMASFQGSELSALLGRPGTIGLADNRTVGPGLRAVAYMWVTLEQGKALPRTLTHRITSGNQSIEGGAVTVSTAKPLVIGPPLRGTDWYAGNGPGNASVHRRALTPLNGQAKIGQRFAIDWSQSGPDFTTFTGDPKDNKNYKAYGREVLAVMDAVVVSTKDGIPENMPGPTSRAVPMNLETIAGNHVVLNLGGGQFAFYAHLQPGSVRVKTGDRVKRGQVIGLVGNTGNSTEPHLHFQISDSPSILGSEGLPYAFASFEVQETDGSWTARHNQIPLQGARVRFPN